MDKHQEAEIDVLNDPKVFQTAFPVRHALNMESVALLSKDDLFHRRVSNICIQVKIGTLPKDEEEARLKDEYINSRAESLVWQYGLPFYFKEWITCAVRQGKFPPEVRVTVKEFLDHHIGRPSEAVRVPLVTEEKEFLFKYIKKMFGKKAKEVSDLYLSIWNERANTRRRSRNLETTDFVEEIRGKEFTHFDGDRRITEKGTYMDAVSELHPEIEKVEDEQKVAQKLRKAVERKKKRTSKLDDPQILQAFADTADQHIKSQKLMSRSKETSFVPWW